MISIDVTKQPVAPHGIEIKEQSDTVDYQDQAVKNNYKCFKMFCNEDLVGRARYKFRSDHWYIDEFDVSLSQSQPGKGHGTFLA